MEKRASYSLFFGASALMIVGLFYPTGSGQSIDLELCAAVMLLAAIWLKL